MESIMKQLMGSERRANHEIKLILIYLIEWVSEPQSKESEIKQFNLNEIDWRAEQEINWMDWIGLIERRPKLLRSAVSSSTNSFISFSRSARWNEECCWWRRWFGRQQTKWSWWVMSRRLLCREEMPLQELSFFPLHSSCPINWTNGNQPKKERTAAFIKESLIELKRTIHFHFISLRGVSQ